MEMKIAARKKSDEIEPKDKRTLNVKVSEEIHRQIRIITAHRGQTVSELFTDLVNEEWKRTSKDILK